MQIDTSALSSLILANQALQEKEAGKAPSAHDHLRVPHEDGNTLIWIS